MTLIIVDIVSCIVQSKNDKKSVVDMRGSALNQNKQLKLHRDGLKTTRWMLWRAQSKHRSQSSREFVAGYGQDCSQLTPCNLTSLICLARRMKDTEPRYLLFSDI